MKIIRKLLLLSVVFIVVCTQLSGCGRGVNTVSTSSQSLNSTSGNTFETNALSTTSSTSNHIETSVPTVKSADSSQSSAASSSTIGGKGQPTTSKNKSISNEDFDVNYKDIILNNKTSLEVLTEKLGLTLLEDPLEEGSETTSIRVAGCVNDMDYYWYKVSYPNKENPVIIYDYFYNATKSIGRIVSMDIKSIPTSAGMAVGDTFEELKNKYGKDVVSKPNTKTTNYIRLVLNQNEMRVVYEKNSGKITDIHIDYDTGKAMEEMDITSLAD